MADITLIVERRTVLGKQVRRLRRQGLIPANVYGRGLASVPIQFDLRALRSVLLAAGTNSVVDLHVRLDDGREDAKTHPVLIEHVVRHPATGDVLHVDFHQVDLDRPVRAVVPIAFVGESPAAKAGGVLLHPIDSIEVEALPRSLPHQLEVDIAALIAIDDQLTIADLRLPPGVTVDTDSQTVLVKVVASRLEQEIEAEAAEAQAGAVQATEATQAEADGGVAERRETS